jgi:hypothetical protein
MLIKLPMLIRVTIRGIEDGFFEKWITHYLSIA